MFSPGGQHAAAADRPPRRALARRARARTTSRSTASSACSTRRRWRSTRSACSRSSPTGTLTVGDVWQAALDPASTTTSRRLVEGRAEAVEASVRADRPRDVEESGFDFPDEIWARVIYDVCLARARRPCRSSARRGTDPALLRRASRRWSSRRRELTTDQAEAFVERQARVFELTKPHLVERWRRRRRPAAAAGRRGGDRPARRPAPR